MNNKTAIIIPARYSSKRFPAKMLAKIKGISVIERVWRIAKMVKNASEVIIATDDKRIHNHCKEFGANSVMTPESCNNGTERVAYVCTELGFDFDIAVNLQGDAVTTPYWIIEDTINEIQKNIDIKITTPAVKLTKEYYTKLSDAKSRGIIGGTTVTFSKTKRALYFSKNIIPFIRNKIDSNDFPVYKHIGLYAYRKSALIELTSYPQSDLELCEGLEQLRALENDIPINIVIVDYKGRSAWSVDNPEDIEIVEDIIEKEGELFQ